MESAAPALSRRHEAGAPSARGMLLTLLGEFVLPGDGMAWTSAVLTTFERLGVAEKATRQALMRTSNAGWLRPEKIGRRTRWQLTPTARALLTDGAERIYSFGPAQDWDGQWVLVAARIPESDRRARHVVRTRLAWAGFGSLGPGMWISPHSEREQEAIRVLREAGAGADADVFVARRAGLSDTREPAGLRQQANPAGLRQQADPAGLRQQADPAGLRQQADMVAAAWDLPVIEAEYEHFIAEFGSKTPSDVLARQLELVHAWRRFPSLDPALPRELLPAQWSGTTAARLFTDRHEQWLADSRQEWKRLNGLA